MTLKPLFTLLLTGVLLTACSAEPTPEEEGMIRTSEHRFMQQCMNRHLGSDKNLSACDAEFKDEFGYDLKDAYINKPH